MYSARGLRIASFSCLILFLLPFAADASSCNQAQLGACLDKAGKACNPKGVNGQLNEECLDRISNGQDQCRADQLTCAPGEECGANGKCVCTNTMCGNKCVNLKSDNGNCGVCGKVCSGDSACQNSACVSLAGEQGHMCLANGKCNAGLGCNSRGLCDAPPGAEGKACSPLGACAAGLSCNGSHICDAPGAQGQACSPLGACAPGLTCTGAKICDALGMEGRSCSPLGACVPGLTCTSDNTCDALGTQGQACSPIGGCVAGLTCTANRICDALGMNGNSCSPLHGCVYPLECGSNNMCQAPPEPPFTIQGMTVVEDVCDTNSSGYAAAVNSGDPYAQVKFTNCISVIDAPPISTQRFVITPQGNVQFDFKVALNDDMSALHAKFKITVTATGPNNESATNSGSIMLYGSQATDVPPNAGSLKAPANGTAWGELLIPLNNIDWAESTVRFQVDSSQGTANDDPITETCTTAAMRKAGLMCTYPDWTNTGTVMGADLSAVNPQFTVPAAIPNDEFALFLVPAVAFQLPVAPVAIVYAPLGNGSKASSQYTITVTTGSSLQVGTTNSTTNAITSDDKTTYSENFSLAGKSIDNGDSLTGKLSGTEGWDNSVETENESTYGTTGSIISSDATSKTFTIPATTTLALDKVGYATQPFWSDEFITEVNPQFAIWDYPGGPIIQPLGSLQTAILQVSQLDACANSPNAVQTATPNSTNQSHMIPIPGTPANPQTTYLWLTSTDCSQILSLDQFYVQKTQSAAPVSYRQLDSTSFPSNTPESWSSTHSTQLTAGTTQTSKTTTKVTAVAESSIAGSIEAAFEIPIDFAKVDIGMGLGITSDNKMTGVTTTENTYTTTSTDTLSKQSQAQTSIQDSSGITVPVNILQDSIFQGIAVEDTSMHYPVPQGQNAPHTANSQPALNSNLPVINWDTPGPRPQAYVQKSPWGSVIVQQQLTQAQIAAQMKALHAAAAKRHFARPAPPPAPAKTVPLKPTEALTILKSAKKSSPAIQKAIKSLQ